MGATRKIPPHLEADVLARAATATTREVASWLASEHGLKVSHVCVLDFLRRTREGRAESAKVVVRERLAAGLTADVDILAKRQAELGEICDGALKAFRLATSSDDEAAKAGAMALYLKAQDAQRRMTETKLRFSGADTPDKDEKATARKASAGRALEELRKLAERAMAAAPKPDPVH